MLENNLREYLKDLGASIVGFADLSSIDTSTFDNMNYGIAFGIKVDPKVVKGIGNGPTNEYFEEYKKINKRLDDIAVCCVNSIKSRGYNSIGQTSTYATSDNDLATALPHKTIATRAGLGWIGKNALLITPEYGAAVRISSVLTDMPLQTGVPVNESKCGKCNSCSESCPASAIKGVTWDINKTRDELLNPFECRKVARELSNKNFGVETSICGKCIEICPFTKRYLKSEVDK